MVREYYGRYRQEIRSTLKELLDIRGKIAILIAMTAYLIGLILQWVAFGQRFVMEETVKWLINSVAPIIITGMIALIVVALRTPAVMDKDRADKYTELEKEKQAEIDRLNQNIVSLQRRIDSKIEIVHGNDGKFYERYGDHIVCRVGIKNKSESSSVRVSVEIGSIAPKPMLSFPRPLHWRGDDIRRGETYKDFKEIMSGQTAWLDVVSIWTNDSVYSNKFAIQHTQHQLFKNLIDAVDSDLTVYAYPSEGSPVEETLFIRKSENGWWKLGIGEELFDLKEIYNSIPDTQGELVISPNVSSDFSYTSPTGGSIPPQEGNEYQVQLSKRKGSRYGKPKGPFDDKSRITRPSPSKKGHT